MENNIFSFECVCVNEVFYSDKTFFGVYSVSTKEDIPKAKVRKGFSFNGENEEECIERFVTLAGKSQRLQLGCKYIITATLIFNEKYNSWQYNPIDIKAIRPSSTEETLSFLKSILTDKQAQALVEAYPNIVDMIINNEYVDLSNVKGVANKTFERIKEKVLGSYGLQDLLVMLKPLGITLKQIQKISGLDSNTEIIKKRLTDNPYILTQIKGLGFKKVDSIASKLNPNIMVSEFRAKAFIKYFFEDMGASTGDTLCNIDKLLKESENNIPECINLVKEIIEDNRECSRLLFVKDNLVGLKEYCNNERKVLNLLNQINKSGFDYSKSVDFPKAMEKAKEELGFELTEEQQNSIKNSLKYGVSIITASAGSGKTISIRGWLKALDGVAEVGLCSLSAKASRRMEEATGHEAFTIHKIVGYGQAKDDEFDKNYSIAYYNERNPMSYDFIVVDEASMNNVEIFLMLLSAVKTGCHVVLVFDTEQLPPIGYGNIATDLLDSDFSVSRLTKVHRQALDSGILTDANKIRNQQMPIDTPKMKEVHGVNKDMCYMFRNNKEDLRDIAVSFFLKTIKEEGNNLDNTIIIVPRKQKCTNSTLEINRKIQDALILPTVKKINRGDIEFRVGCRVIQRANNKDKGVINGELGYLKDIYTKEEEGKKQYCFSVLFDDGKLVEFDRDDVKDMELGYCLTVHSTQGSQWKNVIGIIDTSHYMLLSSNLLYTLITRASKKCLSLAEPSAFKVCVQKKASRRKTWLRALFSGKLD